MTYIQNLYFKTKTTVTLIESTYGNIYKLASDKWKDSTQWYCQLTEEQKREG